MPRHRIRRQHQFIGEHRRLRHVGNRTIGATDTQIVKRLVERIKHEGQPSESPVRSLGHDATIMATGDKTLWGYFFQNKGHMLRLVRRALKKVRQPYRKNQNRRLMKRRAAGKNEVRPNRH